MKLKKSIFLALALATAPLASAVESQKDVQCPDGQHYEIQFQKPSLFGDVLVVDGDTTRHLRFGTPCGADQSSININSPDKVVMEYVRNATLSLTYVNNPKSVLVIGMGGGVFSNLLKKHFPKVEIDAVEIDPVVVDVAKQFFGTQESHDYRIHVQDGGEFVQQTGQLYDIILLDAYGSDGIPEHLATKSFFQQVAKRLTNKGVVVANFGLDSPRMYLKLAERLRASVGDSRCIHGEEESNLITIAAKPDVMKNTNPISEAEMLDIQLHLSYSLAEISKKIKRCPKL